MRDVQIIFAITIAIKNHYGKIRRIRSSTFNRLLNRLMKMFYDWGETVYF